MESSGDVLRFSCFCREKSQLETTDANGEVTGETKRTNDGIGSVSKFANKLVRMVSRGDKWTINI